MRFCNWLPILLIGFAYVDVDSFQAANSFLVASNAKSSSTVLYRAFHKKNKQADLLKKLNKAKEERENTGTTNESENSSTTSKNPLSDEGIKKANDLKRFEDMLNRESATINYELDGAGTTYLTKEQEDDETDASYRRVDRLFEGDPAPAEPFHDLISVKTDLAIGEVGAKNILPWLRKTASPKDYLIVISDPRTKSSELYELMTKISTGIPSEVLNNVVVINSDTTSANRKWLKKRKVTNLTVFSDEKREWMREYSALGEKRWAICMFLIADGRVLKLVREVDANVADNVIKGAVNSFMN